MLSVERRRGALSATSSAVASRRSASAMRPLYASSSSSATTIQLSRIVWLTHTPTAAPTPSAVVISSQRFAPSQRGNIDSTASSAAP